MKTIRNACQLQPKALEINVGDQIEQLDQIIQDTDGNGYFKKTFITEGMRTLLSKGIARLAGKSNALLSASLASAVGKRMAKILLSWIPGAGNVINAGIAASITEGLGWAAVAYFSS